MVCHSHSVLAWIVLRPVIPGTWHWRGLISTVVSVPYVALTTVQPYRPVLPHNSIQGLHYNAMGATHTQTRILLQMQVLYIRALRP